MNISTNDIALICIFSLYNAVKEIEFLLWNMRFTKVFTVFAMSFVTEIK